MTTTFEVTTVMKVTLPEMGFTNMTREWELQDDLHDALTELFHEATLRFWNTNEAKQDWVYLGDDGANGEIWSPGWYECSELARKEAWRGVTPEIMRRLAAMSGNHVWVFLEGVEVRFGQSTWEGVGIS